MVRIEINNSIQQLSEAAEGMEYMALAGWDTQQMMGGLEPILHLAEAGSLDLGRASDLVTDSMSAMGIEVKELGGYLDKTAATASNANTDIDALMEANVIAGGTFKRLNIPLAESNAFLGVMANRGFKGAEAGTAMNAIMSRLTKETGPAADALAEMGVQVFDAEGNFRGMETVMGEVAEATSGMTDKQRENALTQIAGLNHGKAFNAMLEGMGDEYGDLKGKVENSNGALKEMRDIMKDNLAGALEELSSGFDEMMIAIGEALVPAVKVLVAAIQGLVNMFNNLGEGTQKFIAISAALVSAFLLITGPILMLIGFIPMIVSGFTALSAIGTALIGVMTSLSAPILVVVGVITTLIGIGVTLANNWEMLKQKATEVFSNFAPMLEGVKSAFLGLQSSVTPVIESLKMLWQSLEPVFISVGAIIGGALTLLLGVVTSVITGIIQAVSPLLAMVANILDIVSGAIGVIVSLLMGDFAGAWEYIVQIGQAAIDFFINGFEAIVQFLDGFVTTIIDFFHGLYMTLVGGSIIPDMVNAIVDWFKNMFQWVIDIVSNIVNGVVTAFTNIYNKVSTMMNLTLSVIKSVWNFIKSTFTNTLSFLKALVTGDFQGMKNAIQNQMTNAQNLLSNIWNAIQSHLSGVLNSIKSTMSSVWNSIKSLISSVSNGVKSVITSVWNAIKSVITSVLNTIKSIVTSVFNAIKSVITSVSNGIKSTITSVWNSIKSTITTISNAIKTTISTIFNSLKGIVSGAMSGVRSAVSSGMKSALNVVTNIGSSFKAAGSKIVSMIADGIKAAAGKVTGAAKDLMGKVRNFLPFSPAKDGPLRDLHKLNFGGTIADSIDRGQSTAVKAMNGMMENVRGVSEPGISLDAGLNVGNKVASINSQAERQLSHTFDSSINVNSKQPAYINVSIANRDFEGFVEDISEVQDRKTMLEKAFS